MSRSEGSTVSSHNGRLPKVTIRNFDEVNPTYWFQDLEIQFNALGITSQPQMFASLCSLLDAEKALVVHPITVDKHHETPYTSAKELMLDCFSYTKDQRLEKAFGLTFSCEDEKPSQFLARFRILCNQTGVDDIQQWFIRRSLPNNVRLTLQNDDTIKTVDDLVKKADNLIRSTQTSNFASANAIAGKKVQGFRSQTKIPNTQQIKTLLLSSKIWI